MSYITSPTRPPDIVTVEGISLNLVVGDDCWGEVQRQTVIITASVHHSVKAAAESDDIHDALDYRAIYNTLCNMTGRPYMSYQHFLSAAANNLVHATGCKEGEIQVEFPKAILHVDGGLIIKAPMTLYTSQQFQSQLRDTVSGLMVGNHEEQILDPTGEKIELSLMGIRVSCIIGIGEKERLIKQPLVVNLFFQLQHIPTTKELHEMVDQLRGMLEASQFLTVERLATQSAKLVLEKMHRIGEVKIMVRKPSIFASSNGPGVSIVRSIEDFNIPGPVQ